MADEAENQNGAAESLSLKAEKQDVPTEKDQNGARESLPLKVEKQDIPTEKETTAPRKAGVCLIKAEFIDHNHVRELVTEYLPATAIAALTENKEKSEDAASGEPPAKKAKIKGRNKKRPREKRAEMSDRLCPSIMQRRQCHFGDKCKFLHDEKKYMETKPDDLGESCHLYRTYGRCGYGLTCRFAKDHTADDFTSIDNEELIKKYTNVVTVSNLVDKDLQRKLWKRKYNFKKAEKSFQAAKAGAAVKKDESQSTNPVSTPVSEAAQTEEAVSDKPGPNVEAAVDDKPEVPASAEVKSTSQEADSIHTTPLLEKVIKKWGPLTETFVRLRPEERKKVDFSDKLYLAPLTTVGNLPFRRVCKAYGADITCGEMALATNLLQGQQSEWALIKRHESEDIFGAQVCGSYPDTMSRVAQLLCENTDVDFIDINCGCPIDMIFKRGEGSALMGRHNKLEQVVKSMLPVMDVPLTLKMRTGIFGDKSIAHTLIPKLRNWGISAVTLHGRSREQRYTRLADWDYIEQCAANTAPLPFFGNGDILSYEDAVAQRQRSGISGLMLARGALIKPWIFTEIKEERHWDISSTERLDMLRRYCNAGMEHWGSDQQGIANTRRFLLEWLSFLHRYIPVGILERPPQRINEKPPYFFGRNDLETLMASSSAADWVKISEMLLGPVPDDFTFLPKHRANSYS